jgi:hypothetical protein
MDPTMDCCICLAAIEATTSSVRTSCGHTFHFGCLATWSKTKPTCPMCRQAFTETETPDWTNSSMTGLPADLEDWEPVTFRTRRNGRTSLPIRGAYRRFLQQELQQRYALRPPEWSVPEGLDPIDIAFIVEKTKVEAERAKSYLTIYKNPIDVVMLTIGDPFHIPTFRERPRGASEPYVRRDISFRTATTALTLTLHDDGYDSV